MASFNFAQLPQAEIRRSKFNRQSGFKGAFNSGKLIPFFSDEVLPGDTFDLSTAMVARLATPVVPVMDNIHIDTFFFFVPNRLVWDNWEKFCGEQKNPGDSIDYIVPTVNLENGCDFGSVFDYIGVSPGVNIPRDDWPIALPFRACNLIWNEWFRDQNLQDSLPVNTGDGPDSAADFPLLMRGKRHDYFTSALPWPQKGGSVSIPMGEYAKVRTVFNGEYGITNSDGGIWNNYPHAPVRFVKGDDGSLPGTNTQQSSGAKIWPFVTNKDGYGIQSMYSNNYDPQQINIGSTGYGLVPSNLIADLSTAEAVSINALRQAFQMQKFLERAARSGTRYREILLNFFGVKSPDSRLQVPEFLGGSEDYINMYQIAQTSSTNETTPQGNLAAYGYMNSRKHGFTKSFTEHGWIIGFVNVWTDLSYQQGLRRELSRRTRWDYYWPDFAHLGEQAILNKEIYLSSDEAQNNEAFGYQERYAEYRYRPSQITGIMRSTSPQSLDVWHLSQKFDNLPKLSSAFIEEHPPLERVLAVQDEPQIILDAWFSLNCTRPMPLYGIPGLGYRL